MGYGGAFYDKQEVSAAPSDDDYKSMPLNDEVTTRPKPLRGCKINWRLIGCIAGVLLGLILIGFGITLLVFSTTFHSTDPKISVDKFDFTGIELNKTGSLLLDPENFGIYLSSLINVTTTIGNPNNFELYIDYLSVNVAYSGLPLATSTSPGLPTIGAYQNLTTVLPFNINNVPMIDMSGSQSLLSTAFDTQQLKFQFVINSEGHVKVWGFSTPSYLIKIVCDVMISPLAGKTMSQECKKYHKSA